MVKYISIRRIFIKQIKAKEMTPLIQTKTRMSKGQIQANRKQRMVVYSSPKRKKGKKNKWVSQTKGKRKRKKNAILGRPWKRTKDQMEEREFNRPSNSTTLWLAKNKEKLSSCYGFMVCCQKEIRLGPCLQTVCQYLLNLTSRFQGPA